MNINNSNLNSFITVLIFTIGLTMSCNAQKSKKQETPPPTPYKGVVTGAERTQEYLPLLKDKKVAMMVNHTSLIGTTHIVDSLQSIGVNLQMIFAPEHGFRGSADAGDHIENGKDPKTGLPILSLYGNKLKPSAEDLKDIDVIVFDIQDVGVRFYTYISSMHYLIQACAENKKEFIVLDRPNPNIHRIDGPILKNEFKSFIGMHPIPILHGLTVGELAQMIAGENWVDVPTGVSVNVIPCDNYTRNTRYSLPVAPSPNLRTDRAIYLYPSICLFEGTDISVARGTDFPFEAIGSPNISKAPFEFTPESTAGAKNPPHKGVKCNGFDLRKSNNTFGEETDKLNLQYLFKMYALHKNKESFFLKTGFFHKLAGNKDLMLQIETELSEEDIRATWSRNMAAYMKKRAKYLIYKE